MSGLGSAALQLVGSQGFGAALSAAGTAATAFSQYSAAQAQSATSNSNAQIQVYNQQIALANAQQAITSSQLEAKEAERAGRQRLGHMRAVFGASGVVLTGSPLLLLAEQAGENKIEVEKILIAGRLNARSFEQQAASFRLQEAQFTRNAKASRAAGLLGAGRTILGGIADVSSSGVFNKNKPKIETAYA